MRISPVGPLLALLPLLAACQAVPQDLPPSYERLVAQFEAVAFGSDFGTPAGFLIRWDRPPAIHVSYQDEAIAADTRADLADVSAIAARAGWGGFREAEGPGEATLLVFMTPKSTYTETLLGLPSHADRSDMLAAAEGALCFGWLSSRGERRGVIAHAVVLIDSAMRIEQRRSCIHEEIIQAGGLLADACHYRPSLFCEADFPRPATAADEMLLRTLYDPRLEPGMTPKEAMPVARRIIRELWDG